MAGPGRPQSWQFLAYALNGAPTFLGRLSCTTVVAVNNATTAAPFNQTPRGPLPVNPPPGASAAPANLENTLAGKTLILQSMDNAFLVLPADTAVDVNVTAMTGLRPGLRVGVGERFNWVQPNDKGWIKVIAEAGTSTIQVWELT